MARHATLLRSFLVLAVGITTAWAHPALHVRTAKDLAHALFHEVQADACVRLLHRNGTVGCASPGPGPVQGPLLDLRNNSIDVLQLDDSTRGSVAVVDAANVDAFLSHCLANASLARHWTAVLAVVSNGTVPSQNPLPFWGSMALVGGAGGSAWNPAGTGSAAKPLPFPAFFVSGADADAVIQGSKENTARRSTRSPAQHARLAAPMQTGPGSNSITCIPARRCLPVGGHTVFAMLPGGGGGHGPGGDPANTAGSPAASPTNTAPVVLAARQDGASLFHTAASGADSPASGLVAVLAAFRGLGRWRDVQGISGRAPLPATARPIVVLTLAGETWGSLGSKRLLYEASAAGGASPHLAPFASAPAALVEVDAIGRPVNGTTLFLHGAGGTDTLRMLGASVVSGLQFANATTQGLPPHAAARSFERLFGDQQKEAVFMADYEAAMAADTGTPHDAIATLDKSAVARAAAAVAAAAARLAGWVDADGADAAMTSAQLPDELEMAEYVAELLPCLEDLGCDLGRQLLGVVEAEAAGGWQAGYPGILRTITKEPQAQDPAAKSPRARFLFAYAAYAAAGRGAPGTGGAAVAPDAASTLASGPAAQPCTADTELQCPGGGVCVGPLNSASTGHREQRGVGECLNVTAGFVPAYPTALACEGCDGSRAEGKGWTLTDAARTWEAKYDWPEEDVWTESNWPAGTPWVKLLLVESAARERAVLVAGILVAAASVAATMAVQWVWRKKGAPLPTEPT